jgi:hypothetical protein
VIAMTYRNGGAARRARGERFRPAWRRSAVASVLVVTLAVTACVSDPVAGESGGPPQVPDGVSVTNLALQPDVVVLERSGAPVVKRMDPDGAGFLLDGTVRGTDQLTAGEVVLVRDEVVGRVTQVTPQGEDIHVRIEPVALTDVFSDGELVFDGLTLDPQHLRVHAWDDPDGVKPIVEDAPATDGGAGGWAPGPASTSAGTPAGSLGAGPDPALRLVATQQALKVSAGDYDLDLSYQAAAPSGVDMSIGITRSVFSDHGWFQTAGESSGQVSGTLQVSLRNIAITSDYRIHNGKLVRGSQKVSFDGTATIEMTAIAGETATMAFREIVSIPWQIHHTVFVYGVPFLVAVKVKFLISPAVTGVGTRLTFRTHADFAGSGVKDAAQPDSSGEGDGTAGNDGLSNRVDGTGFGVAGMVFAIRPRVGLGLGVPGANAIGFGDAVISAGVVNGSSIGITQCKKLTLDVTVRVGAEADLFGLTVETTHQVYEAVIHEAVAPASPACMRLLGGDG